MDSHKVFKQFRLSVEEEVVEYPIVCKITLHNSLLFCKRRYKIWNREDEIGILHIFQIVFQYRLTDAVARRFYDVLEPFQGRRLHHAVCQLTGQ